MKCRAVETGAVARVHVLGGAAAPLLAAGDELQLDDSLGAERHGDAAVRVLHGRRHEDASAALEGRGDLGSLRHLAEVRRADLLFPFRDQDQVDGQLLPRSPDGVQGGEERRFGSFLIHRATSDHDLAEPGLVDEGRVPRRRGPFGRVDLLHVVHEVETDGARGAGVERREDRRLAVGRDARDVLEAGVARQPHHQVAAFAHAPVLRGDRGLPHPVLQTLDAFVVTLRDLGADGGRRFGRRGGHGLPRQSDRREQRDGGRERPASHASPRFRGHGAQCTAIPDGGLAHSSRLARFVKENWKEGGRHHEVD